MNRSRFRKDVRELSLGLGLIKSLENNNINDFFLFQKYKSISEECGLCKIFQC